MKNQKIVLRQYHLTSSGLRVTGKQEGDSSVLSELALSDLKKIGQEKDVSPVFSELASSDF